MPIPLTMQPKIIYRLAVQEPGGLQAKRRPRENFYVTEPDPATQHYRITQAGQEALASYLEGVGYDTPDKPSAVPIRVMGNPVQTEEGWSLPDFILRCRLAYKLARGTVCHCEDFRVKSDEEAKADNLTPPLDASRMSYLIGTAEEMIYHNDAEGRPVLKGRTTKVCNPASCPRFQGKETGKCKPDMTFVFQVPWLSRYGPWLAFKSTSYRSYQGIRSTLRTIAQATEGWLWDLPLWLCTRIERTGDFHNPVCWVEYRVEPNGEFQPGEEELHTLLRREGIKVRERWLGADRKVAELIKQQEAILELGPTEEEEEADLHEFHPEVIDVQPALTPADRRRDLEQEARVLYQALHGSVSDAEWKALTQGLDTVQAWEKRVAELRSEAEAAAPEEVEPAEPVPDEGEPPAPKASSPPKAEPAEQLASTEDRLFDYEAGGGLDKLPATVGKFAQVVLRALGEETLTAICQETIGADRPVGDLAPEDMAALVEAANHAYANSQARGDSDH